MLRTARRALGATGAVCLVVGCNALAGIQEGELAHGASDSGSGDDGGAMDTGATQGDSTTPHDGGVDGDATQVTDTGNPPQDTGSDTSAPVPVACQVETGTLILVDDLSRDGGTDLQFQHELWVVPAGIGDGTYLVTQTNQEQGSIALYQVEYSQTQSTKTVIGTNAQGGVRLLDVQNTPNGPAALTTYQVDATNVALQIVPLPATWGAAPTASIPVSGSLYPWMTEFPSGGTFTSPSSGNYDWILDIKAQTSSMQSLVTGANGGNGPLTLVQTSSNQISGQVPFVGISGNLYAFVQGLGDASNGTTVLAYPSDFTSPGVQAPVVSNAALSGVFGVHVSAVDSTKVAVFGGSIDGVTGSVQPMVARLPPATLTSLTLGPPQFTLGTPFPLSQLPQNNGGSTWQGGDQIFMTGTGAVSSTTFSMLWLDPMGRLVVGPGTTGNLVTRTNPIQMTALGANQIIGSIEGELFIAWIERIGSGAAAYDQLWSAKVACAPSGGGG